MKKGCPDRMTEKRFKLIDGIKKGTHSGIWDNQKQHNQGIGDELWLGEVVGMLNEGVSLAEEKKQLKEENEKLKQLICDNYEEELCNLCKHQYLVSHKVMQGYYVSKCKKGYEECGTGTVYCCNDFEFKELLE